MLSLPKKKADAGPLVPAWHPDLRIVERLPDTKVVRTAFFLNGVASLVFVTLLLWFAHDRWELHTLNNTIADTQKTISHDKGPSQQAVALWNKFKDEQAKLTIVNDFMTGRPAVSPIILRIQQTLPEKIELTSLEISEKGMTLKANVRGAPDQASGDASNYHDLLDRDPELRKLFDEVTLTSLSKNPATGRLAVEMYLRFKGVVKK
jgi:hypothetical protein